MQYSIAERSEMTESRSCVKLLNGWKTELQSEELDPQAAAHHHEAGKDRGHARQRPEADHVQTIRGCQNNAQHGRQSR